jgi:putative transposase
MLRRPIESAQYAGIGYQALLRQHGAICSMSRKGDCWDNAVVESFFKSLKAERVNHSRYRTCEEARADVCDYIELFYNRKRRHSYLDYVSPVEYELKNVA